MDAVETDVGIAKTTNQDSACITVAQTPYGQIAMAMICDGMGGLEKGELASATVIRAFLDWFCQELPDQMADFRWDAVQTAWTHQIKTLNRTISDYGKFYGFSLGTTVTAMLLFQDTYAEIAKMLNEMNNEGCNFMALVNTIFAQYAGREEEFEKTFGFPMYDEDGNPNWDYVMVDFYCHSGWYNGEEEGLTKRTSKEVWEAYMKSKKIHSEVVNVKVTVDNFYELAEGGEIIIGIRPVILRDSTGRIAWTHENAGHAMVITEVVTIGGKKMYKADFSRVLCETHSERKRRKPL